MNSSSFVKKQHHLGADISSFFEQIKTKFISFASKNFVLVIAATLAIISCFIVRPDAQYLEYFDFKTLTCLFCTLAVICALKNIRFFTITAKKIVEPNYNKLVKDFLSMKKPNKIIVGKLIEKIELSEDGTIDIHYKVQNPYKNI